MANSYDAEAAPAAPADDSAPEQGRQPQQAVNYRMGNPQRSCGLCGNFTGSAGEGAYQCQTVDGEISPYGYCDIYTRQDNPFLAGTQEGFDQAGEPETPTEEAAPEEEPDVQGVQPTTPDERAVAAATAAGPPGGRLRIGNRSYG